MRHKLARVLLGIVACLALVAVALPFVQAATSIETSIHRHYGFNENSSNSTKIDSVPGASNLNLTSPWGYGTQVSSTPQGVIGSAIKFNGTGDQLINLTNFSMAGADTTRAFHFFINTTMNGGAQDTAIFSAYKHNADYCDIEIRGAHLWFIDQCGGGGVGYNLTTRVNDGLYHAVYVQLNTTTSNVTIYVDGVHRLGVIATGNVLNDANRHYILGQLSNSCCSTFNGTIDEVSIFRNEKNTTEIVRMNNSASCSYNFSNCDASAIIANVTTNLTSLVALVANYSLTYNYNSSNPAIGCFLEFSNNNSVIAGSISENTCRIDFQANTSIDISVTPRLNDSMNGLFSATSQPLVRVFRQAFAEDLAFTSNDSIQGYAIRHRVENRILRNHSAVPFSVNSTYAITAYGFAQQTNITINDTFLAAWVNASRAISNQSLMIYTANFTGHNFTQNFSTNNTLTRDLAVPDVRLSINKHGIQRILQLRSPNTGTEYNHSLSVEDVIFRQLNASGNATANLTLEWSGQASRVHTHPSTTNACIASDSREYNKTNVIEVFATDLGHQFSFDISAYLPEFANRATESINASPGSAVRQFDLTTYTWNLSQSGPGNHTVTVTYTVSDNSCGAGGESGGGTPAGGGGGGGLQQTTIVVGGVNLTVRPELSQRICNWWNLENPATAANCTRSSFTNKKLKSCTVKNIKGAAKSVTCAIMGNDVSYSIVGGDRASFQSTIEAQVEVQSIDGEFKTITVIEDVWNYGVSLPTGALGQLSLLPDFLVERDTTDGVVGIRWLAVLGAFGLVLLFVFREQVMLLLRR